MPHAQLNVLILAAGFGTRLKAAGKKTAKGLFKNKQGFTITDLMLNQFKQQLKLTPQVLSGEIALVSNQKFFNQYQQHLTTQHKQTQVKLLSDGVTTSQSRLGSLGDLIFAVKQLDWWQQPLLVLPSDRSPEKIIASIIAAYIEHPDSFITCLIQDRKENIRLKSGCAQINQQQQVIDFVEKPQQPQSTWRALPFYIFPPQALELLQQYQQQQHDMDSPGNIVPWLLRNHYPVQACIADNNPIDIGDLQQLKQFQQEYTVSY